MKLYKPERRETMSRDPGQFQAGGTVEIDLGSVTLEGNLGIPEGAQGIVLFAHGSGSSRFSPRNRMVAEILRDHGLATLLIDLLTGEEESFDHNTREFRFNIALLSERLGGATNWLHEQTETQNLNIGYFGAGTGAACALLAATEHADAVKAIVSRGGRPDLAKQRLSEVRTPTLFIVGSEDTTVTGLTEEALDKIKAEKKLEIVEGASHLFEESGKLEEVAGLAQQWFQKYLTG